MHQCSGCADAQELPRLAPTGYKFKTIVSGARPKLGDARVRHKGVGKPKPGIPFGRNVDFVGGDA
jgi:hypothetical protein